MPRTTANHVSCVTSSATVRLPTVASASRSKPGWYRRTSCTNAVSSPCCSAVTSPPSSIGGEVRATAPPGCRQPVPASCAVMSARATEGIGRRTVELVADHWLIAHDPCVMTGRDRVGLPRTDVALAAVVVADVHSPGKDHAEVRGLAALGARDGLDAFRPLP